MTVTDFGAPSTFVFTFITPIAATAAPNEVDASLSGALTDASGDGVSLIPSGGSFVQLSSLGDPQTNMGVDIGGSVSGPATGIANSFSIYGPFDSDLIPGPGPGPWTSLTVVTSFTLSGNDDVAALSGSAEIVQVPTPNMSFAGGVFLLAVMPWRGLGRQRPAESQSIRRADSKTCDPHLPRFAQASVPWFPGLETGRKANSRVAARSTRMCRCIRSVPAFLDSNNFRYRRRGTAR